MDEKIREIFKQVLKNHYIDKNKVGLWLTQGEARNSFVGISEEEPINYQIFFYYKGGELEEAEWKVLFHELGHIIEFEKLIQDKGMEQAREEITRYEREVDRLRELPETERQNHYKQIEMEKQADAHAATIYNTLKEREII